MLVLNRYMLGALVCGLILTTFIATSGYASNAETVERLNIIEEKLNVNLKKFFELKEKAYSLYDSLGSFADKPYLIDILPIERLSEEKDYRVYEVLKYHIYYVKEKKDTCNSPFLKLSMDYSEEILETIPAFLVRLENIQDSVDVKTKKLILNLNKLISSQQKILNELVVEAKVCLK